MTAAPQEQVNPYLRTTVLTASPEQLRLMLLDGAIKFLNQGRRGLAEKDYEAMYDGFRQSREIVLELLNAIQEGPDQDLTNRMRGLYTYMYSRMIEASHERDLDKADEILKLLDYERDTWQMLINKLADERTGTEQPAAPQPDAPQPLSIEG